MYAIKKLASAPFSLIREIGKNRKDQEKRTPFNFIAQLQSCTMIPHCMDLCCKSK